MKIEELPEVEANFMRDDEELKLINDSHKGTEKLIQRLIQLQRTKMFESIPDVRQQIREKIDQTNSELATIPEEC